MAGVYDESMRRADPWVSRLIATGCLLLGLAPACSSGGGGSSGQVCTGGFDGGASVGGTEAVSESGQCGNLLMGTTPNGGACKQSSECAPTCCACPGGSSKSAQVAWCNMGQCVVGNDVCCAWIDENSIGSDAGPFVCTH